MGKRLKRQCGCLGGGVQPLVPQRLVFIRRRGSRSGPVSASRHRPGSAWHARAPPPAPPAPSGRSVSALFASDRSRAGGRAQGRSEGPWASGGRELGASAAAQTGIHAPCPVLRASLRPFLRPPLRVLPLSGSGGAARARRARWRAAAAAARVLVPCQAAASEGGAARAPAAAWGGTVWRSGGPESDAPPLVSAKGAAPCPLHGPPGSHPLYVLALLPLAPLSPPSRWPPPLPPTKHWGTRGLPWAPPCARHSRARMSAQKQAQGQLQAEQRCAPWIPRLLTPRGRPQRKESTSPMLVLRAAPAQATPWRRRARLPGVCPGGTGTALWKSLASLGMVRLPSKACPLTPRKSALSPHCNTPSQPPFIPWVTCRSATDHSSRPGCVLARSHFLALWKVRGRPSQASPFTLQARCGLQRPRQSPFF